MITIFYRSGSALIVLSLCLGAGAAVYGQEKSKLNLFHIVEPVRIFYTDEGPSAVSPADTDNDGVPDRVDDVAKQVWAARELFCKELKFQDPIGCERYPKVTCIEVGLRSRDEFGKNGVAFESAQKARPVPEGIEADRALVMTVATSVNPASNATPAHEFFHLIQYGSTYFKNSWYLEGQARWAERALGEQGLGDVRYDPQGPWPQQRNDFQQLVEMTYDAEFVLWNPIAKATDPQGVLPKLSEQLHSLKYSDGSLVVQDDLLNGHSLMREILTELGRMDDITFSRLKYREWSEGNQKSQANSPFIYEGVMNVLRRHQPKVGKFHATPR